MPPPNSLVVTIDATTAQFDRAMSQAQKATLRYETTLRTAQKAQADFDATVAASGAASEEAALAQQRLGAALARTTEAEIKAGIAAKAAGEIQEASSAKAAAAAEKSATAQAAAQDKLTASRKASAASAVSSLTGFSAQTTGVLALGAAFVYAVKSAASFDAKIAQIKTLTGGSADQIAALSDATKSYADIGVSASQAADAEIELVKAGVSVTDIINGGLSGALNLAAAGQLDVGTAAEIASAAMVQFGLAGKDIPHIADLLAAGANKSLGSVQDLGLGLKAVGTTAHQAGFNINETVGALAALASAGLTAELGGTALKQMFLKLESPSAKAAATMKQYGISLYDAQGNVKSLAAIAGQLQTNLKNLTPATRNAALATIFGSRAVQAANVLYQQGQSGIKGWTDKVNDAGAATRTTKGQMDSLTGDLDKLKAKFENLATSIGDSYTPTLRQATEGLSSFLDVAGSDKVTSAFGKFEHIFGPGGVLSPVGVAKREFNFVVGFDFKGNDGPEKVAAELQAKLAQAAAAARTAKLFQDSLARTPSDSGDPRQLGASIDELGNSYAGLAPKAAAAAGGIKSVKDAQLDAIQATKDLTKALQESADALTQRGAMRDYADAIKAADDAQKKGNVSIRDSNVLLDAQASAALNVASQFKAGGDKQIASLEKARTSLYQQAVAFGFTKDKARDYVDQVLKIPDSVKTKTDIDTVAAKQKAIDLLNHYKDIDGKDFKSVTEAIGAATTIAQLQSIIAYENALQGRHVATYVDTYLRTIGSPGGHSVYSYASGGPIHGIGTATSDSNLVRASKGEFMQQAAAVRREGVGKMQALNDGRATIVPLRGLSAGGSVGRGYASSLGASGYRADPAMVGEIRSLRSDLKQLRQHVIVDNAQEIATGVRHVSRDEVQQAASHAQTMADSFR